MSVLYSAGVATPDPTDAPTMADFNVISSVDTPCYFLKNPASLPYCALILMR
jgi:hypothetical protein